jgi:hypothetical protein
MMQMRDAATALRQNFSGLALVTEEAELRLAAFVAANERLGVEGATSAQNLDTLTRALGQTTDEAQSASNEIIRFGLAIGMGAGEISQSFTEATPFVTQFGDNAVDVFKELQIQAEATGVSISSLISAIEGLDTFQGAANAAASLNAALGTSLNSFELLESEGVDKIRLLQENLQRAGVQFGSLNRFQQRFIAQQTGFSNIADAARVFSGSAVEQAQALRELSREQQDLDARRQQTLSIQEKLTNAAMAFATAAEPILDILNSMANGIQSLATSFGNWGATIAVGTGLILAYTAKIGLITPLIGRFSSAITNSSFVQKLNNKVTETSISTLNRQRVAAKTAGIQMVAFGAALFLAGAGIGLAALGLAQFAEALQSMSAEQIALTVGAILALGVAMGVIAAVATGLGTVAYPALLAFGFAVLMIGGALALAATGFAQLANLATAAEPLTQLALAAPGLLAVAASIGAISAALWTLPNEEMINFAGAMAAYADAVEVSAQSPEAVREIKETIATAATIEAGASLAALFAGMAAMAAAVGSLGQRPVEIRVNERVLGDTVVDVFNDRVREGLIL